MLITALAGAGHAVSGIAAAVKEANDLTDSMIANLKANENLTVNRVGRVLEGVKFGFLLGYVSPSILTAVGVCLTTGSLTMATGAGIALIANPVAGVSAAVGAVFFGWKALNDREREDVINQVGEFLKIGVEQIKAVVEFAIKLMKDLFTADNIQEIKETVAEAATIVGRHISDITKSVGDKVAKFCQSIASTANSISNGTKSAGRKVKGVFGSKKSKEATNHD